MSNNVKDEDYTKDEENIISIFVTNLRMYNGGMLHGEWFDVDGYFFPDSDELKEDFDKLLDRIGCSGPGGAEWFVTDYDGEFGYLAHKEFGEYPGFDGVKELAELSNDIEDMNEQERLAVKTLCTEHFSSNVLTSSIRAVKRGSVIFYGSHDEESLGREMSELLFNDLHYALKEADAPHAVRHDMINELMEYFDFERYGKDTLKSGTFYELPDDEGYIEFIG